MIPVYMYTFDQIWVREKTDFRVVLQKDALGFVGPPVKVEIQDVYFKILLEVAAADGELTMGKDSEVIHWY